MKTLALLVVIPLSSCAFGLDGSGKPVIVADPAAVVIITDRVVDKINEVIREK